MSWETLSDDLWSCPKCGKEIRIRIRMDDWNRRECIIAEEGKPTIENFSISIPPKCQKCNIEMVMPENLTD